MHSSSAECYLIHLITEFIQYSLSGCCGLSLLDAEINEKGRTSQELPGQQGRARDFEGIRTTAQSSDAQLLHEPRARMAENPTNFPGTKGKTVAP